MWNDLLQNYTGILFYRVAELIIIIAPLWVPILLGSIFWNFWVRYVQAKFFFNQKYVLLEVKLPKETNKSPLAMELFLSSSLHITSGEGTWYDKYILGKTRPWFSLEMVSIEGQVKFFIWTRQNWRNIIESGLYSQYPDIEIFEAPDYTKSVHFDPKEIQLWAADLTLTKPDPYPIKTYLEYGLEKDPKEEFKIDPITPMIEFLGSIGQNQQIWIQFVVRAHKEKPDTWKDAAIKEIEKIRAESIQELSDTIKFPNATKEQQNVIEALSRSITKLPFDVGIRTIYIAKNDSFNPSNITGIIGNFKQYNSEVLNGFKPANWMAQYSGYPWEDWFYNKDETRSSALEAYKRRSYFFHPFKDKHMVLNTEELATIYHFPGSVLKTPTFGRIQSKKVEAPTNLPI
jgi:hypothetical protein